MSILQILEDQLAEKKRQLSELPVLAIYDMIDEDVDYDEDFDKLEKEIKEIEDCIRYHQAKK